MKTTSTRTILFGGAIVLAGLVYAAGRAKALGPASVPVVFTGYLQNDGHPLAGAHQIGLDLWDDPASTEASSHVCSMAPAAVTADADGLFQIALSSACVSALPTHPSLWYQFALDGTELPRTAVGAVPFATWAGAANTVLRSVSYALNDGGAPSSAFVSALGSVCGSTAPTSGSFSDASSGLVGIAAAKVMCQSACGSQTAHICLREDLDRFQKILGATIVKTTGWVEDTLNECQPVNAGCGGSCSGSVCGCGCGSSPLGPAYTYAKASTPITCNCPGGCTGPTSQPAAGITYGPNGISSATCDTSQPILCCD